MDHQFAPAGLETEEAERLAKILQERLASLVDLSLILKHVHWNVVGPGFMAVHEMMDEQTTQTRDMIDSVAERITTLGAVAAGLATQVVEMRSTETDYALGRAPVIAHLGALDKVYEQVGAAHRQAIDDIGDSDLVSQDLLVSQTAMIELNHWFVRAHLEDTDGRLATEGTDSQVDAATAATFSLQPDVATEKVDEDASE
jgi:starvation-inducible DNA-binding protein